MLQQTFKQIVGLYAATAEQTEQFWHEIVQNYTGVKRHYHNLQHLENILTELKEYGNIIEDWDVIIFSTCYHDIIYDVLRNDNEELSALFAGQKLSALNFPLHKIEKCKSQIMATNSHDSIGDADTDMFTDADLAILGKPYEIYLEYCAQVRNEYDIYPGVIYKLGRKKVLQHFLQMDRIFKTWPFFTKYEKQARENMAREIDGLQ